MESLIGQPCVYLKDANLGESFLDILADLIADRFGRVKVYLGTTLFFYMDLNHLSSDILRAVSKGLVMSVSNRILTSIQKRITALLESRILDTSSE